MFTGDGFKDLASGWAEWDGVKWSKVHRGEAIGLQCVDQVSDILVKTPSSKPK